jgi:hypothetical protein
MNPVTREHRVLAVKAMYPDCEPGSYMWDEFVEKDESKSYRTLGRVAQALADAKPHVVHIGLKRDLDLIHRALYTGQVSAAKVDAQRALDRVMARFK